MLSRNIIRFMPKHRKPQTCAKNVIVTPTTTTVHHTKCTKCGKEDDHMYQFKICSECFKKMYETPRDKQVEQICKGHDYFSNGKWIVLYTPEYPPLILCDAW